MHHEKSCLFSRTKYIVGASDPCNLVGLSTGQLLYVISLICMLNPTTNSFENMNKLVLTFSVAYTVILQQFVCTGLLIGLASYIMGQLTGSQGTQVSKEYGTLLWLFRLGDPKGGGG